MKILRSSLTRLAFLGLFSSALTSAGTAGIADELSRADRAAGHDLRPLFEVLCPASVLAPAPVDPDKRETWYAKPQQAFDDLYYVGQKGVSAWLLKTSDGLVLIDTLFAYSAPSEILDGVKALGFSPRDIRYVIITHAHLDHFGGARLIRDATHAPLVLSAADWASMAAQSDGPGGKTESDLTVETQKTLQLGQNRINLIETPGHTAGTLSLLFTVHDHGRPHTVALWGGTAFNSRTAEQYRAMAASASLFAQRARESKADVWLSNHPVFDDTFAKLASNAEHVRMHTAGTNAFVSGGEAIARAMTIVSACSHVALARDYSPRRPQ